MTNFDLAAIHVAPIQADLHTKIHKTNTFVLENSMPDMVQHTFAMLQLAHDNGFTVIKQIKRDAIGSVSEVIFDQVLTPTGQALLKDGPPKMTLPEDTKALLKKRLDESLVTGKSGGPAINGEGKVVGVMDDFLTPDQIRENARRQLKIMEEQERASDPKKHH